MTATIPTMPATQTTAAKQRVMVIAPGYNVSTIDVYNAIVDGLRALPDVDVLPFPFHTHLEAHLALERLWKNNGVEDATEQVLLAASNAAFPRFLAFRPQLVIVVTGTTFPLPASALMAEYTRTAVVLTESPYQREMEERLSVAFHDVFTNERASVGRFVQHRRMMEHITPERVHYLPHMYDPARHYPRQASGALASDVCFVGSPFPERLALFSGVDWSGIQFVSRGLDTDPDRPETAAGFVTNDEAHELYASAKIVINHHRTIRYYGQSDQIAPGEAESLNPRAYELAAAGVFQVCDDSRPELAEVFGDSIPTYRQGDSADLERVLRHYLAQPEERRACVDEARRRVAGHDCASRARYIVDRCNDRS